jgi:hypothetical protein
VSKAGTKYEQSGRFNKKRALLALLVCSFIGLFIGKIFAWSMNLYLRTFCIAAMVVLTRAGTSFANTRSKLFDFIFSMLVGLVTFNSAVEFMGMNASKYFSLLSLLSHKSDIDFLVHLSILGVFVFPVFIILATSSIDGYYCEPCRSYYAAEIYYYKDLNEIDNGLYYAEPGNYTFLKSLVGYSTLESLNKKNEEQPIIYKIHFSFCKKCRKESIINISTLRIIGESSENKIVTDMHVDEETNEMFLKKINNQTQS